MTETVLLDVLTQTVLGGSMPPPDPPTRKEFARTLKLPAGRKKGKFYDPDSDPNQRYAIEQIDLGRFQRFAFLAPPQVGGKTQSTILPTTLHGGIELREPVGYGLPTLEALDKAWNEKLKPSIIKSGYGRYLPTRGPGSKGGRGNVVDFWDPTRNEQLGSIVFMTGGSYGSTVRCVVVDDIDQFRKGDGPDREAVEDIFHRADSYGDEARRIAVGTIEYDVGSLILALIEDSTHTQPFPACPACRGHQLLVWDNVVASYDSDTTARDSARYRCQHCAVLWTEDDRQRALENVLYVHRGQHIENGAVVGPEPESRTLGLVWNALSSTLANLGELAQEYRNAMLARERGDHAPMRKFYRYRLCLPYTADRDEMEFGAELTAGNLLDRSIACKFGPTIQVTDRSPELSGYLYSRHVAEPPHDAIACVAGIDVQNDRVYWVLVAVLLDGSSYDVAWGYEYARLDHRPWSDGELFELLDRTDAAIRSCCGSVTFGGGAIDSGDFTAAILAWQSGHRGMWFPVKGARHVKTDGPFDLPGMVQITDEGLLIVHSENTREALQAAYRRPNGTVGAAHIPCGLSNNASDMAYPKHLVAEMSIIDPKTRKKKVRQGPGRWDWLDARRYAKVIGDLLLRDIRSEQPPPDPVRPQRRDRPGLTTPDGRPFLLSQR